MADADRDALLRMAAFEHVRRLGEVHDHLTAIELGPGFVFDGERIPLINPQRGIFKPQEMRYLIRGPHWHCANLHRHQNDACRWQR